jgi:hypothetical protein
MSILTKRLYKHFEAMCETEFESMRQATARNRSEIYALWDKHNRLLKHLGLEDVVMPEEKIIRESPTKATDLASEHMTPYEYKLQRQIDSHKLWVANEALKLKKEGE